MLKISRRTLFAALGTLALLLPQAMAPAWAAQQQTPFPFSVTDDSGTTTTFAAPPQRNRGIGEGIEKERQQAGASERELPRREVLPAGRNPIDLALCQRGPREPDGNEKQAVSRPIPPFSKQQERDEQRTHRCASFVERRVERVDPSRSQGAR